MWLESQHYPLVMRHAVAPMRCRSGEVTLAAYERDGRNRWRLANAWHVRHRDTYTEAETEALAVNSHVRMEATDDKRRHRKPSQ